MSTNNSSLYKSHPNGEGVLITGCSSGIGRTLAIHLAQRGFTVFATVRKQADAENLRSLNEPNLVPTFPLDLAKPEHIPNIYGFVVRELEKRGQKGLYAVINNAGGGSIAPIELMDLEKFRTELLARILGPVALLQHFLPLVRQAGGRVLWIVTPGLIPIPYVASIHACDFAVNCLVRTLNIELKPWNIPNVMIRCGGIQTDAPAKNAAELQEALQILPLERSELYANALQKNQNELANFDISRTPPEAVAKVVFQALCARKPRRRGYQVGYMSGMASFLEGLPQPVVDSLMAMRD
jgi:NAD(P)-dependent dehydrogenase (short-subunit alcohol dehydrogenase family)